MSRLEQGISESPFERLGRRLLVPVLLAAATFLGLAMVADGSELLAALREFDPWLLLPILSLSLANYSLRFLRWQLYLRHLDVELPVARSLGVFLVGFLLSVTPGKAGELGKGWLIRRLGGGPARLGVAAVLAERVTDLLAVFFLAALGSLAVPGGVWLAIAGGLVSFGSLALLHRPALVHALLGRAGSWRWSSRLVPVLTEVYDRLRSLLGARLVAIGGLVAGLAWGAEGLGFALAVRAYAPETSWLAGIFSYNLSTLLGALSMLPGGLLATEGSMTALLGGQGLPTAAAASVALIVRGATLWFAVALGALALPFVVRLLRRQTPDASGEAQ